MSWVVFLQAVLPVLKELFDYIKANKADVNAERDIVLHIIRLARDAQAQAEINGSP